MFLKTTDLLNTDAISDANSVFTLQQEKLQDASASLACKILLANFLSHLNMAREYLLMYDPFFYFLDPDKLIALFAIPGVAYA